ncbi:MAG TPA: hypothetical protein VIM29_00405 [Bacillota bacterium]
MRCIDCGNKVISGQEYCNRCGAELYKKKRWDETKLDSVLDKLFRLVRAE